MLNSGRSQRRRVPVWPVLSHGEVEDAKHVDALAGVCVCQLRLHLLSGSRSLGAGHLRRWHRVVAPHPCCPGAIRTETRGGEGPRRPWPPLPSARTPASNTGVRLNRRLQCVPSRMPGSAVHCRATEWYPSSITQRAWAKWHPCPHGKRTAWSPSLSAPRRIRTSHLLGWNARGRVPFLDPLPGASAGPPAGTLPFGSLGASPLIAAPRPLLL